MLLVTFAFSQYRQRESLGSMLASLLLLSLPLYIRYSTTHSVLDLKASVAIASDLPIGSIPRVLQTTALPVDKNQTLIVKANSTQLPHST